MRFTGVWLEDYDKHGRGGNKLQSFVYLIWSYVEFYFNFILNLVYKLMSENSSIGPKTSL